MKKIFLITIACIGIAVLVLIDRWQVQNWREAKALELSSTAQLCQTRLENAIDSRFNAVEALSALFTLHPGTKPEEFAHFAENLLQFNPPIRALQFADSKTRVTYVYPPKGNEVTIRNTMLLLADPKRGPYVEKAIAQKSASLQGPFKLRQGGTGVVVRSPIFLSDKFIGLSIGVYDVDSLITEAFAGADLSQYVFQIADAEGKIFIGANKIFDNFLKKTITVADTNWSLVLSSVDTSTNPPLLYRMLIWFCGGGLLLSLLMIIHLSWLQEQRLKKTVDERTSELYETNQQLTQEIKEHKQAENELILSKKRYQNLFQNSPVPLWEEDFTEIMQFIKKMKEQGVHDLRDYIESNPSFLIKCSREVKILDVNKEALRLHDVRTKEELLGNLDNIFTEKSFDTFKEEIIALSKGYLKFESEGEVKSLSGEKKKIYIKMIIDVESSGLTRALIATVDITERNKMEDRLRQSQKMESIGQLAGGIAHDFNNLLFPIIGMAELLLEDLPEESLEYENAQEIFNAGLRAGDLVKQILAFSRQTEHKMVPVSVQIVLKEVLKLSRSTIPTDIEIHQDIQADCGLVRADATQIHQVLMNLITNAYHAVQDKGGIISVQLKQITLETKEIKDSLLKQGQYLLLNVSDTGVGIEPNIVEKIFDPYFTTKKQGKGTGLGLAVVFGIIKEHQGDIKVYSEIDKGTTFNVYLPLIEKPMKTVSTDQVQTIETGTERILLVDDEESVLKIEAQMLSRLGYIITDQIKSLDALKLFKSNPNKFDLIITDMTMPDMTGAQLANEILSISPNIPIIICTGFSERISKEQAEIIGVNGFLMKPVVKFDMAQMVRKVLDEDKTS